ncbi:helix-turn-helix transcriptional regulator [Nocardia sp. NBC_01503]|uniref:response regulator transcription factor n=1 Tax=Nocardia sp. NBC_01503 TaxID=2975997 RepID=UPI002E7B855A|nr:helix-turn-helix transcriptional regulator [Nocardia sp. NBC_01503]WTL34599.1 helix-turn-helix transcriptional regulator [Nocardia sp. NBC_01503]
MRFLERTQALEALRAAWEELAAGAGDVVVLSVGGESGLFIRLPDAPPPTPAATRVVPGLTDRQQDVLDLLCAGLTNTEIAEYLVLSVRTVDHHVSAILRRLGVHNRRAARAKVLDEGEPLQSGHRSHPRAILPHLNTHHPHPEPHPEPHPPSSWPAPGSGLTGAGERSGGAEGGKNRGHRAANRRSAAEAN